MVTNLTKIIVKMALVTKATKMATMLARRVAPLPSAGDGATGRGEVVSRSRWTTWTAAARGRRRVLEVTRETGGKRHGGEAVERVEGGVGGGVVEGGVGVPWQPQHGQHGRHEVWSCCRAHKTWR